MTVQLDNILTKVKVRSPNPREVTTFCVVQILADHERVFLQVACTEPDNFKPEADFTVVRGLVVMNEYPTAQEGLQVVRETLHYVAKHEVDENLEYEGRLPFNPHDTWSETQYP
jgi:hypothetical protein